MLKNLFNSTKESRILWGACVSPYVRKVQVVMLEKDIAFELKQILPTVLLKALGQEVPVEFAKSSLLGRIPALQDGEDSVADSAVITGYLEKKYPKTKALYPTNPIEYARALWLENYADHVFSKVVYDKIFLEGFVKPKVLLTSVNKEIIEKAIKEELPDMLRFLEDQIQGKEWLVGNKVSIADIAIATHFVSLQLVGYKVQEDIYPNLYVYLNKVLARPSFQEAINSLL